MESRHDTSHADRLATVEQLFADILTPSGSFDCDRLDALCRDRPAFASELRAIAEGHAGVRTLLAGFSRATDGGEKSPLSFRERYQVLGEIARGGMGVVLEVWDAKLRCKLAMKALRRDHDAGDPAYAVHSERRRARLVNEAQVLAQLEHPGIVPVHDVGLDDRGEVYFTMLRVRGETLGHVFNAPRSK